MRRIYTKTGDTGQTGLYGGERVPKNAARVEAYGAVDELNASLGVALCVMSDLTLREVILRIQSDLFVVGGDLATPTASSVARVAERNTRRLEKEIDAFESELPALANFILPGGSAAGAALHLARAICRRAERRVVTLMATESINPEIERYLNRLSDDLFVLARLVNRNAGSPETVWTRDSVSTDNH